MKALAEALQVCKVVADWKSITGVKRFNKQEANEEIKLYKKLINK